VKEAVSRPGFNSPDSHKNDLPRYQNYIEYEAYYDFHISSRDRKEIEKTIESKGGHVIRVTYLG
jgi:hypothetical protein